jgi:hypothetical protein
VPLELWVSTDECEEKWHKNLKSGVQPTPETSCILSTVSTMVNVEIKKSNTRKCNRTTGSINRPAFSASSTAMQARNQFRTIWWSAESTHFPGLAVRIYVNTMPRELQSLEILFNGEGSFLPSSLSGHGWWQISSLTGIPSNEPPCWLLTLYLQSSTRPLWRHVTPKLKQCRLTQLPLTLRCHRTYSFIRPSFLI